MNYGIGNKLYTIEGIKFDKPSSCVFDRTEWDYSIDDNKIIIIPKEKDQT